MPGGRLLTGHKGGLRASRGLRGRLLVPASSFQKASWEYAHGAYYTRVAAYFRASWRLACRVSIGLYRLLGCGSGGVSSSQHERFRRLA